jgi:hypothetical protein
MAGDHRGRHAGEEAGARRVWGVEVGVRVEPDGAAATMFEAGEDTEAGVAGSGEDDG